MQYSKPRPQDEQRRDLERDIDRLTTGFTLLKDRSEFAKAVKLAREVGRIVLDLDPKFFSWGDQTYRAAVSAVANICESEGRAAQNQVIQYARVGRGSAWECKGLLIAAPVAIPPELLKLAGEVCQDIDRTLLAECSDKLARLG